jgi:hypothetical protein
LDDVLKEDVFDHQRGPIDLLDARDVNLSNLTNQEGVLIETLSSAHSVKQIRIHQADPLNATYIENSETSIDTGALKTIQESGYAITEAGTERPLRAGESTFEREVPRQRAAVEFESRSVVFDA